MERSKKRKRYQFIENGGVSSEFLRSVKAVAKQLPKPVIAILKKNCYKIVASKTVSSKLKEL